MIIINLFILTDMLRQMEEGFRANITKTHENLTKWSTTVEDVYVVKNDLQAPCTILKLTSRGELIIFKDQCFPLPLLCSSKASKKRISSKYQSFHNQGNLVKVVVVDLKDSLYDCTIL